MAKREVLNKIVAFTGALIITFSSLMLSGNAADNGRKFNMSYIYFGGTETYISRVEGTKGSLDEISPNYFNLESDGTLKLTSVDTRFIDEMHKKNIKVVPFLSNHWDRELGRLALKNRVTLAREIADAVKKYNLDGINVDIENVTEADRTNYTDFVRILRQKLPSDKTIAVAVAANPYSSARGWQGSYDYKALAANSDYLMIMAYDEHFPGGSPGSVASLSFVENSIKYALKYVPEEKIVLGIPFFGRYWKYGDSFGGYGVSLEHIEELIRTYNGRVTFDPASRTPKAVVTIKQSDPKPYVGGKRLSAGTYEFWYENEESLKQKLKLVQKYNIKGTGSWSLGHEGKETWDYYELWLNGHYFIDAEGHWAQKYIMSMNDKAWMKGISDNYFAPENFLTRAEAAVILVRALGLGDAEGESAFDDIAGHWARKEIGIAYKNKIVFGKGDSTFAPDEPVTREELAAMMDRILVQIKDTGVGSNPFKDINPKDFSWSYDSIVKMSQYGIFTGRPDGKFYPKNKATRAEMAALMNRASTYLEDSSTEVIAALAKINPGDK